MRDAAPDALGDAGLEEAPVTNRPYRNDEYQQNEGLADDLHEPTLAAVVSQHHSDGRPRDSKTNRWRRASPFAFECSTQTETNHLSRLL
jgi:hypothetical protein